MKKWTGVLVSLLVLILAAYYVMGYVVERTFNRNVNAIPKNSVVNVHLHDYQRGWFSSKAILSLIMHVPAQKTTDSNGLAKTTPPVDMDFNVPVSVQHGPVIFADGGIRFGMGQISSQPQTHYGMLINFLNRSVVRYTLPAFSMEGNVGTGATAFKFDWKGLRTVLSSSADIDNINGSMQLFGLSVSANDGDIIVGEIKNNFDLQRDREGLWLGDSHFVVPLISVSEKSQQLFSLEGMDLNLGAHVVDESLNANYELLLAKLFVNGKTYGPGNMALHIRKLDPAVMAKINQSELNMINSGDTSLPMLSILADIPKLVAKGAELEFTESFDVPEGKVTGNLKMWLPENAGGDPGQLVQKAKGEGQFRAPVALVKELMLMSAKSNLGSNPPASVSSQESVITPVTPGDSSTTIAPDLNAQARAQVDGTLQKLTSKGILKLDGGYYVIDFTVENQQVMVNGQPFTPDMLN